MDLRIKTVVSAVVLLAAGTVVAKAAEPGTRDEGSLAIAKQGFF